MRASGTDMKKRPGNWNEQEEAGEMPTGWGRGSGVLVAALGQVH